MTDPITLAREVVRQHGHLDRDALSRREKERLDLARAALRMEALADGYDAEARLEMREGDVTDSINTQATADRIRAALNGDKG